MSDKLMHRIGALLVKAENASTQAEADAYMSKAQELATLTAIDLEVARQKQLDKHKREVPEKRYVQLLPEGMQKLRQHFITLAYAVAGPNDVKMTYYSTDPKAGANLYGFPSDIDVTLLLFQSLAVQMKAAADAYIKGGEWKGDTYESDEYDWNASLFALDTGGSRYKRKPVNAMVARNQFYTGFVGAIGSRLDEARREAVAAHRADSAGESTGTDLVLKAKAEEVATFYKENSGRVRAGRGNTSARYGGRGGAAGTAAGNSARLASQRGIGSRAGAIA